MVACLNAPGAKTCDLSRALATAQLLGNARAAGQLVATLDSAQATLATRLPSTWPPLLPPLPRRLCRGGGEARCLECLATPTHQPSLMRLKSVRGIYNQFLPTAVHSRETTEQITTTTIIGRSSFCQCHMDWIWTSWS